MASTWENFPGTRKPCCSLIWGWAASRQPLEKINQVRRKVVGGMPVRADWRLWGEVKKIWAFTWHINIECPTGDRHCLRTKHWTGLHPQEILMKMANQLYLSWDKQHHKTTLQWSAWGGRAGHSQLQSRERPLRVGVARVPGVLGLKSLTGQEAEEGEGTKAGEEIQNDWRRQLSGS